MHQMYIIKKNVMKTVKNARNIIFVQWGVWGYDMIF